VHILEWNALVNRAHAILRALRSCQLDGHAEGSCPACPVVGVDREDWVTSPEAACRAQFRATERRLCRLAREAPRHEQTQFLRTVDGLHLAYRQIGPEGTGP